MREVKIIAAIGTPLDLDERLDKAGMVAQLERLWAAGIKGAFVGGTLGMMPLLSDETYTQLIRETVPLVRGRGELLVGASDVSLKRTLDRVAYVNGFDVDGVVVMSPYFINFSQSELIAYFRAVADDARAPLYLYDVPQRTRTTLELETVLALAEHPNIAGIKCSGDLDATLKLMSAVRQRDLPFRVIVARIEELSELIVDGVHEHLDGIFALAPRWTMQIASDAARGVREVTPFQEDLVALRDTMRHHGGMSALTVLMNACGVPGCFGPRPFASLTHAQSQALLDEPVVQRFLAAEVEHAQPARG